MRRWRLQRRGGARRCGSGVAAARCWARQLGGAARDGPARCWNGLASAAGALSGIAVTVGPGSFTGVRAALALAHGMALGAGVPVWGITVGAALRAELGTDLRTGISVGISVAWGAERGGLRPLWVAVDTKRGRVFLDDGVGIVAVALDALPSPAAPIAVAGDAAIAVVSRLAARGFDVQLLEVAARRRWGSRMGSG